MANKLRLRVALLAALLFVWNPRGFGQVPPAPITASKGATLFAVADVVFRGLEDRAEQTGLLMEKSLSETPKSRGILPGDVCNDEGDAECFDRVDRTTWGKLNSRPSRLYPVPGNHEYLSGFVLPFHFLYWENAGPIGFGYYWFDWGGWRIFALNSELMERSTDVLQQERRRNQLEWLERELRRTPDDVCTLTYFHRPPFSSGDNASPAWTMPLFRKMYKWGVDFYVVGHEHFFASLPPLSPLVGPDRREGVVDLDHGIRGLIVGTGGAPFHPDPRSRKPRDLRWRKDGEELLANTLGITRIDLEPGKLKWAFVPVARQVSFRYPADTATCHDRPRGYVEPLDNPAP